MHFVVFPHIKRLIQLSAIVFGLAILTACFHSSDSAPPNQDASGIYTGSLAVTGGSTISDLKGMVYNNRFLIFSTSSHLLFDGSISAISSTSVTATADVYENGVKAKQPST